jgi:TolB-like protein
LIEAVSACKEFIMITATTPSSPTTRAVSRLSSASLFCMLAVLLGGLLAGCAVVSTRGNVSLAREARWALLPIANNTEVPQAGLRAEAITEALLHARGLNAVVRYPATLNTESLIEPAERKVQAEAAKWAREQGIRYGVQGAVDEWRYKVGVDGEPAVGIALQVIDLQSGEIVWSAVGARSGWSRESLAAVAQKLIGELLARAPIQ